MKRPPTCTFSILKIHEKAIFPVNSTRKSTLTASPLEGYAHTPSLSTSLCFSPSLSPLSHLCRVRQSQTMQMMGTGSQIVQPPSWPNCRQTVPSRSASQRVICVSRAIQRKPLTFSPLLQDNTHIHASSLSWKLRSCIFMWLWCSFAESVVSSATYFKQNPWLFFFKIMMTLLKNRAGGKVTQWQCECIYYLPCTDYLNSRTVGSRFCDAPISPQARLDSAERIWQISFWTLCRNTLLSFHLDVDWHSQQAVRLRRQFPYICAHVKLC